MRSLIFYTYIQFQILEFFRSCYFADEVKIQIELDASHEDLDDAEADKLLFGGAEVRECELK